ncbi:MAG: UDP-N-acetylmuramoyl-tripeptide--D-alanyl-D-alanine ligase [Sulfuricellaceae bacterium]|nr:UDP-N-acetylmuramoyl-tripeptide--D-alanyl-D-alanine ligase [Sulfuricellaceae bacterium]
MQQAAQAISTPAISAQATGADVKFAAVTTDSRAIAPGDLFVALRGERFDGHEFVAAAIAQGAVGAIVDQAAAEQHAETWQQYPLLVVPDTRIALGKLAAYWRQQHPIKLAAITGSNGKTTVKEMLASILSQAGGAEAVLSTKGNLNNDIGMPMTLLKLRKQHRYAVIEMGMNHPGEIAYLSQIAQPDVAVINNAGAAHLAGLGSVEAVARAKGEIFQGLKPEGVAIINADDAHADLWRALAGKHKQLDFGLEQTADVSAHYQLQNHHSVLEIKTPEGTIAAMLPIPGRHNIHNALAACAAARALGISNADIAAGLTAFSGVKGRLQRKRCLHGATLIDDTYNANPASVDAAIAVLAAMDGKKILVLGDMGELGDASAQLHRQIGQNARQAGIDVLLALGDVSRECAEGFGANAWFYERIQELLADLENHLTPDTTVLVKGSRFMQMERVVKSFEVKDET